MSVDVGIALARLRRAAQHPPLAFSLADAFDRALAVRHGTGVAPKGELAEVLAEMLLTDVLMICQLIFPLGPGLLL